MPGPVIRDGFGATRRRTAAASWTASAAIGIGAAGLDVMLQPRELFADHTVDGHGQRIQAARTITADGVAYKPAQPLFTLSRSKAGK